MRSMLFLTLSLLFGVTSYANADCSKIEADAERLSCYDAKNTSSNEDVGSEKLEAGSKRESAQALVNASNGEYSLSKSGAWIISDGISDIDDTRSVILLTLSDASESGVELNIPMTIRCISNQTNVVFAYPKYLGSDSVPVTYRVDKEKAVSTRWDVSNDGRGAFVRKPIGFIKSLLGKDSLYVSITPYASNSISTRFDLTGLDGEISLIRETCDW